ETSKERAFREESRTREGALPLRSSSGISSIGGKFRYEKMKLQILSWEGEKRIQAKIQMERKK
ncbi:hypothetical protein RYX36_016766, partial [Vicia faba]